MTSLASSQREHLAKMMDEREPVLREEIRAGLRRMRVEGYDELLSGTSDAGDESLASLVTDINNADAKRDAVELQDIFAARARMADGTYGICIDCDVAIPYERLEAYPTAKRCLACQQVHEAKRAQR
ncbi:TraR/DksA C4-type zinc finger protein [Lysobacter ciconiae]|uniref:TraR/DksA C4-type zinc finger protein n=1 Tax=Novilysobacter ciconiae TaxID=2781022 RepID=A0A7S6UGK5_9GAMM|nr:TraR/DksA C4-type zinc finger protein [Lysobacter ciconiae]QOW19913.1 TraR/DksA C4-type zinc finger protein [Lysobacter ciconiae]